MVAAPAAWFAMTSSLLQILDRKCQLQTALAGTLVLVIAITRCFGAEDVASSTADVQFVALVVGAPGAPEYETNFLHQVSLWQNLAQQAGAIVATVGTNLDTAQSDLERFRNYMSKVPKNGPTPLWLVLIGHGTFDGLEARFNLRGPDLTTAELAELLEPFTRPVVVINTASASAPFLTKLSHTNRIVITATKSGHEQNFTRFGLFFAQSWTDPSADIDGDGQVSLLEAFLAGSRRTAEFYRTEGRLATEHALLDDNGDGLGTPADWFRGARAVKKADSGTAIDGAKARRVILVPSPEEKSLPSLVRAKRDAIEAEIERLREAKQSMPESQYLDKLEELLVELAKTLNLERQPW